MKQIFTLLLLSLVYSTQAQQHAYVPNQLIVKLKAQAYETAGIDLKSRFFGIADADALAADYHISGLRQIGQHGKTRTFLMTLESETAMADAQAAFEATGLFEYVTPNYYGKAGGQESIAMPEFTPNDVRFNRQWSFVNIGEGQSGIGPLTAVADADTDMDLAWDIQTGDPNMIIAVIDGGARMTHPDFASRIWTNTAEIANGIDDDGNGLVDDLTGWDFFFNDNDTSDERGHGTNVCGIIGAVANNNLLYAGANWNSKVMVLKTLDYDLNATYASVADAAFYAVDKGAKILNISIGFPVSSTLLTDFVSYARDHNVLISACMMNFNNNTVYYPAGYSTSYDNVIAVGATSPNDYRTVPFDWSATSGSNYGPHINVTAPGAYIYNMAYYSDTVFTVYWSGTSMATPLVASIASLVWAEAPNLTPAQVRAIIEQSAQDGVGNPSEDATGFDQFMGHGRANANAAVLAAQTLARSQFTAPDQEFSLVNPVRGNRLELLSNGNYPGSYQYEISNMEGGLVGSGRADIGQGPWFLPFDQASGSYILTLKSASYQKVFKILKP